jgi:hypothetical protein
MDSQVHVCPSKNMLKYMRNLDDLLNTNSVELEEHNFWNKCI